jgi:ABC-type multidrug transport system ATPase subunit
MTITLENIGKRYRYEWIFKEINTQFEAGKRYAIIGPNGAGKSTFLKILCGHLSPSKGKITFSAQTKAVEADDIYQHISYAAPYIDLIEEFSLQEAIVFHARFKPFFRGISPEEILQILDFPKHTAEKEVRFLSSGMKQRVKLVLSICSDTPILILDEPTTNLDKAGAAWYHDLLNKYAGRRTVLIASNVEEDFGTFDALLDIRDFKPTLK